MKKRLCKLVIAMLALVLSVPALAACSDSNEEARSKYTISADVNADEMTVSAVCDIDYVNRTAVELDEIWFHLYPAAYRNGARYTPVSVSDVESAYPHGVSYGGIEIVNLTGGEYEIGGLDEDILVVKLPASIMPTERASVHVEYKLKVPEMRHRFGYCDGKINLGNWFPVECAYDGGFDSSPYYSSGDPFNLPVCDYDVTITAPSKYTVAMPAKSERAEDAESGKATTKCALHKARDFAAVLGEFDVISENSNGVEVKYYYTFDDKPQEHLKAACDALAYFSSAFGAYPYDSYAVVQTPFNQGGMEYTGLVYVSDAARDKMITEVVVHETAHQWWYGMVGNDQVKHAWLDEALAEYSTSLFYKNHPDYGVKYEDRIADAMGGFSLYCELSKCEDTSMDRSIADYATDSEYTYMTYVKGQLMYDSLYHMLGENALAAGLKSYVSKCSFSTARPEDLIACIEKSSGRTVKPLMDSYIDGTAKLYSIGG